MFFFPDLAWEAVDSPLNYVDERAFCFAAFEIFLVTDAFDMKLPIPLFV
jgi:hypothetical protein